jgi:hypothetical protein
MQMKIVESNFGALKRTAGRYSRGAVIVENSVENVKNYGSKHRIITENALSFQQPY